MIKDKSNKQDQYHADPRNEVEQFMAERIPLIVKAYGLGNIRFYFITKEADDLVGAPEDGVFMINYDQNYKAAYILIAPNAMTLYKSKELTVLRDSLVHEIGHIITHRLAELAARRHTTRKDIEDTVEETTESIAQIVRELLAKVDPVMFG